jgi:hypothetical protein
MFEYRFAKSSHYFRICPGTQLEEFMPKLIGVYYYSAEFGKNLSYFGLAGA